MANSGGLAIVLLAAFVGLLLALSASGLLLYGLLARDAQRGFKAAVVALVLSMIAALLSTSFWRVLLSGQDTHGEPIVYGEAGPIIFVVVLEAAALAGSLLAVVRQARRRRALGRPEASAPTS